MPPLKMVHEYTEGTLILDVLDAATKSLGPHENLVERAAVRRLGGL